MKGKKLLWLSVPVVIIITLVLAFILKPRTSENQKAFLEKAQLFKTSVVTDDTVDALGESPVDSLGHVVFLSVCDGTTRAKVYTGTGKALSDAWDNAVQRTVKNMDKAAEYKWLRADVVNKFWPATTDSIIEELDNTPSGFDFNGLAFDDKFDTAALEGELNGWGIYDYKNEEISIIRLNKWLEATGRRPMLELPEQMTGFECWGWFCDENNDVFPLYRDGADKSRRQLNGIDGEYAKNIVDTASSYLADQVKKDGTFIYNYHPQVDKEMDDYNMLRHSGTIWSLICRYRLFPEESLKSKIDSTIDYLLSQIVYDEEGAAYLYESKSKEIKLGGNGITIVTLTEYMDVFQNEDYREVCEALGEGILKQQDPETGSYWHILGGNFIKAEEFRTIYYDGECTFALARLYSLTRDKKWLDGACKAIDHFIEYDYTQYRDHWVAYSLNEVTKYVDKQEYYNFALSNAVNNYKRIRGRYRTYPVNLELLISSFETWQRMVEKGIDTGDFDVKELLDVISARANRQLSGYFYPELAMYMANPQRVLGSFMMRDDKFRVRIDDVQHNIGGYYLYWKNYDAMVAAGLDSTVTDSTENGD